MWLFLWRASLLYVFPLLMWAYCRIKDIEFAELDTGVNTHKWVVLAAYLIYVVLAAAQPLSRTLPAPAEPPMIAARVDVQHFLCRRSRR